VQIDTYGSPDALRKNMEIEFSRNRERYEFLKWSAQAFKTFETIPPGNGICHQINLEYVSRVTWTNADMCYPDSLVGIDSHTTMVNGLGVLGWGVGGIEAEAAMLGQPMYFLEPDVVGVHLTGRLGEGVTATDLVLTITQLLRQKKVVGKFVEYFGEGAASLPIPDRATIGNMSPEYGATCGFFPVDDVSCEFLRMTGRGEVVPLVKAYYEAQGMYGMPKKGEIDYSEVVELDLSTVKPAVSGPRRPHDRIDLPELKSKFDELMKKPFVDGGYGKADNKTLRVPTAKSGIDVGHGDVLISAITSCTNTSNPGVLLGVSKRHWVRARSPSPNTSRTRGSSPTSNSSATTSRATAARRASATRDRSTARSKRPSPRTISWARQCFRGIATSKRASTRRSARTS
jgi:aconitate hydratase